MSAIRRLIMSAIALGLLYGNAMVALQPPELIRLGFYIPHPEFVRNIFELTSMFTNESQKNADFVIYAKRTPTGRVEDRGRWLRLPLIDHFPRRDGITAMQFFAPLHERIYGAAGRKRAWSVLAAKIRANHNRLHPDLPVERIRLDVVLWPPDPRGFRAAKEPGTTQERMWFIEPPE